MGGRIVVVFFIVFSMLEFVWLDLILCDGEGPPNEEAEREVHLERHDRRTEAHH